MPASPRLLFTCEHGGCRVPAAYAGCFRGQARVLHSHRGWDPGALVLARELARAFRAPLVASQVSRLVVDLNRSLHHPRLLSPAMRSLDAAARDRLLARHYHPHRGAVERHVTRALAGGGSVVHVAVHSFTPVLGGVGRDTDLGLLYDPRRRDESALALRWQRALALAAPELRVRRNHPYRGVADGLTTHLRRLHPRRYVGLELEVSQALVRLPAARWRARRALLRATLAEALR